MTNIIVELGPSEYNQLKEEANRLGKAPDVLIQDLVIEHLKKVQPAQLTDKELTTQALKAAGLLTELSPGLQKLADPKMSLEEVQEALSRDGVSLSQIVIDGRGPKG